MFRHGKAQRYEARYARKIIKADFAGIYESWERARADGHLWQTADDLWFQSDSALWAQFVAHVRDRKCLEIGSGPFGYLAPCYWIRDRVFIDPLIDVYRAEQLKSIGKTFFTDDVRTFATNAEIFIEDLSGSVDGCIVCRNALDHCEDPLAVLDNIGKYARPGCFLLLWSDIWRLAHLDIGHRNITHSEAAMDALLEGLGFTVLKRANRIRDPEVVIEYGRLARKNPHTAPY